MTNRRATVAPREILARRLGPLPVMVLGVAAGGVALGHAVAYALVARDAAHRANLLAETGHALWHGAAWVVAAAAVGAASTHLVRQFRRGRTRRTAERYRGPAARLALVQSVAFVAMEVVERLDAGVSLATLLERNLLLVGLAAQVVVALVLSRLVTALGRAAEAVGRAFAPRLPTPPGSRPSSLFLADVVRSRLAVALRHSRAPPITS